MKMGYCYCIGLLLSVAPLHAKAPCFEQHLIAKDSPLIRSSVMSCVLTDLDGDGDLDWTLGTIWPKTRKFPNNRLDRMLYWYEYCDSDTWVLHETGIAPDNYGGVCSFDVNGDGWQDIIAGNLWLNRGKGQGWDHHRTGIGDGAHDMQAVDINGDSRIDVLVFTQKRGLNWMEVPDDPTQPWTLHKIAPFDYAGAKVHATGAPCGAADLDGDGDTDVAAVKWWFENTDGKGRYWDYHKNGLFPGGSVDKKGNFPWGYAVKTVVHDMDSDGDMDIVQSECDTRKPAGIVWLENTDGKGDFKRHWIKHRCLEDYHSLAVLDYNNDGDWDVLSGTGPLGSNAKRAYLFENCLREKRSLVSWQEHVIHSGMEIHESVVGDVDRDGDTDIVLKPWNKTPGDFVYLENMTSSP